nr:reverse transcriptase domain-containing protein [Tanacetum cinerariifolium]
SRVIHVGDSSGRESLFHIDNGMRFMLALRSARAKHSSILGKSNGMRNFSESPSFSGNFLRRTIEQCSINGVLASSDNLSLLVNKVLMGDILLLEAFLNDDPSLPPPTQGKYLPQVRKELKFSKAKNDKSSIDEPLGVELKDLPPHLEYAFLEGDDKLPVIISKDLSDEEKTALIKVLKLHNRAIAWKLSDIK